MQKVSFAKRVNFSLLLILFYPLQSLAQQAQSDVILQGFYWNSHPGDITTNTGVWWDTLATVANELAEAGFRTVWVPPASKGFAGVQDMGYGISDYFDLGEFNQHGTIRTRHGNRGQLDAMIAALHNAGLKVMADVVLNHRGGAAGQQLEDCDDGDGRQARWTKFQPASGRLPGDSTDFHPNTHPGHCNLTPPYHDRTFFEDLCYFHGENNILDPGQPSNGWYFGPHQLGHVGDSLVVWGRWLIQDVGFDEVRLDAVRHIEPGFMAPFLVELANGAQPFAVGEFFDANMGAVKAWHDDVEAFVSTWGTGSKDANIAMFDFNLRYALRDLCNNTAGTYNMADLNGRGLRFHTSPFDAEDIVTFVENHDVDRTGIVVTDASDPDAFQFGNTFLKISTDSGHDPVVTDKHIAYAYILAAEGRPSVFWKDFYWYGLDEEITWLMALRRATATGASAPMNQLNPFFPSGTPGNDASNLFALRRAGSSGKDGLVILLNDHPTNTLEAWLDTPFQNSELRDYSDSQLFASTQAFGDTRALLRALPRNYAWYALTGLYPQPPGEPASHFTLGNHTGAKLHYIALRASDAANLIVNGQPIQPGDEVAILPASGNTAVGLGRIGQSLRWDGVHDMIIEVLGGNNSSEAKGGLLNGQSFRVMVYDQSTQTTVEATNISFAPSGTNFNFSASRPPASGGSTPFNVTATHGAATYQTGAVSLLTAFTANSSNVVLVEAKAFLQGPYQTATHAMNTYLSSNGLIPATAPYTENARTVSAVPAGIADWVLLQLRTTPAGATVVSHSAFLHADGRVVDDDGTTGKVALAAPAGSYYIILRHRNHLAIMSASAVPLNSSGSTLYDFTSAQSQAYGLNPMSEVETGVFAMRAGDGNSDGGVDALDRNLVWRPQNGTTWTYQKYGDFSLDGGIDALDRNLYWRPNNGTGTQVP